MFCPLPVGGREDEREPLGSETDVVRERLEDRAGGLKVSVRPLEVDRAAGVPPIKRLELEPKPNIVPGREGGGVETERMGLKIKEEKLKIGKGEI